MSSDTLPRLRVAPDGRRLETANGSPFFWLGDTAWELFHRLDRAEAAHYLDVRARQGFNVIQAVALAELGGLDEPNRYGALPLHDADPARPNEAYFQLVDEYIALAAARGLYVALLPTWGDKVARGLWAERVIFTPENALAYGRWLGRRYREAGNLVWVLGGDRPPVHAPHDDRPIWRALAAGLRAEIPAALLAYHPNGGLSSGTELHDEPWLDLNMMQSGHGSGHDVPVWAWVERDRARVPPKPALDAEPNYEDHPVSPWPSWDPARGRFDAYDVRRQCYRSVLAGACGVTYGHHSVWQFYDPGRAPITHPDRPWREALERPGAAQMGHLRALMEARPQAGRVPEQALVVGPAGEGLAHARAARGDDGSYAFVYIPDAARRLTLDLARLAGPELRAWWYDPRDGSATDAGTFAATTTTFTSPAHGPDWVLVLDSVGAGFDRPGRR